MGLLIRQLRKQAGLPSEVDGRCRNADSRLGASSKSWCPSSVSA